MWSDELKTKIILLCLLVSTAYAVTASSDQGCAELTFMPAELDFVGSHDSDEPMLDLHTFNKFHAFQIGKQEGIAFNIPRDMLRGGQDGFLFRLRAEYASAERSRARMNLQITVMRDDKVIA